MPNVELTKEKWSVAASCVFFFFQRKEMLQSVRQKHKTIRSQKAECTNKVRKQPCTLLISFENILMLSSSKLGEQVRVRKETHYPKPRGDSHLSMPYTLDQSSTHKTLAKDWAFQLDKLLPHLISQDWAVFISERKTSGNLRRLLMSLSSLMLLKHCYVIAMEFDKTFVVWNRTQKPWILTKFGCKENIFHN